MQYLWHILYNVYTHIVTKPHISQFKMKISPFKSLRTIYFAIVLLGLSTN